MKSFLPMLVGILLGMLWIVVSVESVWFGKAVEEYGFDMTGLCLGGPALMLMFIGIFITMFLEDRG